MENENRVALFRYQVIAPLLSLAGSRGALRRELLRMTERFYDHPERGQIKIGFGTLETWLYAYKRQGFEGLHPRRRQDRGTSRVIDDTLAEVIEELVAGNPRLDGPGILAELASRVAAGTPLPSLSTVYRFLKSRGLNDRRRPPRQDHRAYAFELAGDCWQGDVMYGPSIPTRAGTRKKTYLIALLDDATRLIPHGQFYFEQHLRSFKDCLKQAFLKRGLPRRLYFDNGRVFRSRLILVLAARLGIQIIHSRPYRPQGRAKIERFFGTVRRSFLARVDMNRIDGLEALNRLFGAWVEGEYHVTAHRGLRGETPLDCWLQLSGGIRSIPADTDLDELFLEETTRRVARDGTIALKGKAFEVGPRFIGERVTVCFDPFDLRRVIIIARNKTKTDAFPVDLHGNRFVKREPLETPPAPPEPPELRSLDDLADRLDDENQPPLEEEDTAHEC